MNSNLLQNKVNYSINVWSDWSKCASFEPLGGSSVPPERRYELGAAV